MCTPVKRLLSPQFLSPIRRIVACTTKPPSARTLFKSPEKNPLGLISDVKIEISKCGEPLVVDTPKKSNLLAKGLSVARNLQILGKGSFGTVVRGIYKGRDVAVKITKLSCNHPSDLREANALHLNHENVVHIIEVVLDHRKNYGMVLMEFLHESLNLQTILARSALETCLCVKFGLDIARGLRHCHEKGILHLDVKPSNVLVHKDVCKLCDFGNSVQVNQLVPWHANQCTAAYAAPEVLQGERPTPECDIYSLGVLLWQMRFREAPYEDVDNVDTIIYKVVKFGCRPRIPPGCTEDEYCLIFRKCWSSFSSQRPDLQQIIVRFEKMLV